MMTTDGIQKKIFITEVKDGQQVNDLFLVSQKNYAETKAGKPYLALTLMDRSGEIEGRVWDNAAQYNEDAEVGNIISVQAQVKSFRDQLQLAITSLQQVDEESVPLEYFMPASKRATREMKAELLSLIDSLDEGPLKQLALNIFQGSLLKQFMKAPAAKRMHHACLGGLAEHTLSVAGLAVKLAAHYPELDRDLFITGALVHDIGKILEFDFSTVPFAYTDSGRLIGHLVLGSEMIRQQAAELRDLPAEKLDQLVHLVLSHHGRHEFGSPCLPMTMEAILLHHIDDIDAKMNYIEKLSDQVEGSDYQWSDYQRPLERFLLLKGRPEDSSAPGYGEEPSPQEMKEEKTKKHPPGRDDKPRQTPLF